MVTINHQQEQEVAYRLSNVDW